VVFASNRILTGNTIIIEHLPGLFSIYYHMSALDAAEGQIVEKGQVIGKVGMTGFATGPHLHWEIQSTGIAVDPDELTQSPLLDTHAAFYDIEARNSTEGR
jgi:murein DD-endopeptidase MepM/ murein hydrolase activator NlpD